MQRRTAPIRPRCDHRRHRLKQSEPHNRTAPQPQHPQIPLAAPLFSSSDRDPADANHTFESPQRSTSHSPPPPHARRRSRPRYRT